MTTMNAHDVMNNKYPKSICSRISSLSKNVFADNLLTPMSSNMSMSFFGRKEIKIFEENLPE